MATVMHGLKIWPEFFEAVISGDKTFEVRRDDRGFTVGDTLLLREWNPDTKSHTGRLIIVRVPYIMRNSPGGVHPDFVVMSIVPIWESLVGG